MGFDLPPLRDVIAAHDLRAKKSFGQNFLLDLNLTRKIARAAGDLSKATVYEVGPGPGGLTRALLMEGTKHVHAVEMDPRCLPALAEVREAFDGRLTVHEGDALAMDELALIGATERPIHIVANLPYNVGTALLIKWLTVAAWPPFFASLTLMFQREVAQRIVAVPGSKAYGRLSVLTGFRSRARILFDVPPQAFTPAPKVTSSIVQIIPTDPIAADVTLKTVERIVAAGFGKRRKMLRASLKGFRSDTENWIESAGIKPTARAEEITVEGFAALARML